MEEPLWVSHQRLAEVSLGWAVGLFNSPGTFFTGENRSLPDYNAFSFFHIGKSIFLRKTQLLI